MQIIVRVSDPIFDGLPLNVVISIRSPIYTIFIAEARKLLAELGKAIETAEARQLAYDAKLAALQKTRGR